MFPSSARRTARGGICEARIRTSTFTASASQARARRFKLLGSAAAKLGWHMQDYNEHGAAGNAKAATADKGRRVLDAAARQLALRIQEFSQERHG